MARVLKLKMNLGLFKKELCSVYMFFLTFLSAVVNTHMTLDDSDRGFIQSKNNDVRFMGVTDGLRVLMHQDVSISNLHEDLRLDDDAFATSTYLKFVPPQLDFEERYLGVPHLEKVTLINTDPNRTIHLSSISGNTLHFHSSFFQDKTIPPKGNTTFAVVLLARAEGSLSSRLHIHTSEGTFRYQVLGSGISSPYRLRPLAGVRLPLHAVYQPLVWLHNPHRHPIQVVEVYSSGSQFHLELPGGEAEAPQALWEVPPFTTKPVIKATFEANMQSNHSAYIRLKLNQSGEVLVVPVDVEVTEEGGLYPVTPILDFGLGGSKDVPRSIKLQLKNSLKKALRVVDMGLVTPSEAVSISFQPVKVPSGSSGTTVATLTFDWDAGFKTQQTSGHVWVKVRGVTSNLEVPYTATVLQGGLFVHPNFTQFLTKDLKKLPHLVKVQNNFKVPVAINHATLHKNATEVFQLTDFVPTIIAAGKSAGVFTLGITKNCDEFCSYYRVDSTIVLNTNISDFTIRVRHFNGRLTLVFPHEYTESNILDLGLLSAGTTQTFRFGLENHNHVPLNILTATTSSLAMRPKILGVFQGNVSAFVDSYISADIVDTTKILPGQVAVLQMTAEAPKTEKDFFAELAIETNHCAFIIHIKSVVAQGELEVVPKDLLLEDCFPGKICRHQLKVQSTFNRPMTGVRVTAIPPDPRLSFSGGSNILPSTSNYIGELTWEPWRSCGATCYLGLPLNATHGPRWIYSAAFSPSMVDNDLALLKERYYRLLNMTHGGIVDQWEHFTLKLHTNELRELFFRARVRLTWPRIANTTKLTYPLTQVTNTTLLRLKLYNPASHLILVQLVMDWAYPQPKRLVESFPDRFRPSCGEECFNSSHGEFFIFQDFSDSLRPLGVFNTTLAPSESYEITIGFNPSGAGLARGLLFIRNNLTVMEAIELEGKGAHAQLKFGNRRPGAESALMFDIVEKHLKDCQPERTKKLSSPNLTVKRSFTARNVGDLPIYVHSFSINGLDCEGFGFAVLNCSPFLLMPNATRKIDIAFTPDFTLSKVTRTLHLTTTIGADVNYTMVTTLPPYFLSTCSAALGRPTWEPVLYYSAVSFMLFLLFCVLAAAFFESDRLLKCSTLTATRDRLVAPLDLRQVGATVLKELNGHQRKTELENGDCTEKSRHKDSPNHVDTPGWITGLSADDRQFEMAHRESQQKTDHDHEKEQLNNHHVKQKKRLSKRISAQEEAAASSSKRKPKSPPPLEVSPPEPKPVKVSPEPKKEDVRKDEKEKRQSKAKRNKEAEEETSSTMTDSSNDAEKDCRDEKKFMKESKEFKKSRNSKSKNRDDTFEDTKTVQSRTIWRMGGKSPKTTPDSTSIWKHNDTDAETVRTIEISKSRGKNANLREKKDRTLSRRVGDQNFSGVSAHCDIPPSPVQPVSRWGDHRSFSDVVASDSSLLYSNIVQAKHTPPPFSNDLKKPDPSAVLGPIGSKKPTNAWTCNPLDDQSDLFSFPSNRYPEPDDYLLDDDSLPLDAEDRWEDQNDFMQMMHNSTQSMWKGTANWTDSVWRPNVGELASEPCSGDLQQPSWGSLLRASWSPPEWSPRPQDFLPQPYIPTEAILYPTHTQPTEEEEVNMSNFDPFHSLGNIWSPAARSTWAAPGAQ